jgi:hypothetical protein
MKAQSHGGMEQYYSLSDNRTFSVVPLIHYETNTDWSVEGRYNYEAPQTMSVYAGKTFKHDGAISFVVNPIAGLVAGRFNGGSVGANIEVDYKGFMLSSQPQYTFSIADNKENFIYSWSDFAYQASAGIAAGVSIQQLKLYQSKSVFEGGFFLEAQFKSWSIPFYIFNPTNRGRYFILGLNCEWQYKKSK